MPNYEIKEISNLKIPLDDVKEFLFKLIKDEYGLDYVPKYHDDIKHLEEYYIYPERSNFYVAFDSKSNEIIGTLGIREYDMESLEFPNLYSKKSTASFYRVFVHKNYRRKGVASDLVKKAENFCYCKGFNEIYLHTQKFVNGALAFWLCNNFNIRLDSNNKLKTVHMDKMIKRNPLKLYDISLEGLY